MEAELTRQLGFFDPNILRKPIKVSVIGAGALGSHIVEQLVSIGIKNIRVFDFDAVESHNIPNQIYMLSDVGKPKVEALCEWVKNKMGYTIEGNCKRVESLQEENITDCYLIRASDTIRVNKNLIELTVGTDIQKVVEAKMSVSGGTVYFFDPNNPYEMDCWAKRWYDNPKEGVIACTERACAVNIAHISALAAGCIMIDNMSDEQKKDFPLYHQTETFVNGSVQRYNWFN